MKNLGILVVGAVFLSACGGTSSVEVTAATDDAASDVSIRNDSAQPPADGGMTAIDASVAMAEVGGDGAAETALDVTTTERADTSSDQSVDGAGSDTGTDAAPSCTADAWADGTVAVVGDPCPRGGALACAGNAQPVVLECDRTSCTWTQKTICPGGRVCSSKNAVCTNVLAGCLGRAPGESFCSGSNRITCGPDLVDVVSVPCASAALCNAGTGMACAACLPGEYACEVDTLKRCNVGSTGFEPVATCLPGLCDAAGKQCDICATNDVDCLNDTPRKCATDGQSWVPGLACGPVAAGTSVCRLGACTVASCSNGFDDCNKLPGDGCEQALNQVQHCASCSGVCAPGNAVGPTCATGSCDYASCTSAFQDCDGNRANGCESTKNADDAHCGNCSTSCATTVFNATNPHCNGVGGGACTYNACTGAFQDCDGNTGNGCESNKNSDNANCGQCSHKCDATTVQNATGQQCNGLGACDYATCSGNFQDCDGNRANGCESNKDADNLHCGGCPGVNCTALGQVCLGGACAPSPGATFTGIYTVNVSPTAQQCSDFVTTFRNSLSAGVTYSAITLKGSKDPTGVTCTGSNANVLCQAIRTATAQTIVCDGRTWTINVTCCGVGTFDISSAPGGSTSCACAAPYALRPCVGSCTPATWGGIGGINSCGEASQTITLVCQ